MPGATRARIKLLLLGVLALLLISEATNADNYKTIENPKAKEFGDRVCINKECTQIAARYLLNRNEKANPCDDFVTYACGNAKFHGEKDGLGALTSIAERKIRKLLDEPTSPNEKSYVTLTKLLYQKCLDKDSLKASRKAAILSLLDEIGGWPLLKPQWTDFASSWEEYIAEIHQRYKVPILFQPERTNIIDKGVMNYALNLKPIDNNLVPNTLKQTAIELGVADPATLDDEIAKFMTDIDAKRKQILASTSQPLKKERDTLANLKSKFTNFNIKKYIDRLFEGIQLPQDAIITVHNPDYFEQIAALFNDKRVLANYAASTIAANLYTIDSIPGYTPKDACYAIVNSICETSLIHMYVDRYFKRSDYAPEMSSMLNAVSEELKTAITEASWLDDATRAAALEKLANFVYFIGYPDHAFNDTFMEEKYSIPFDPSDSFHTLAVHLGKKLTATTMLSEIGVPRIREQWGRVPYTANAVYNVVTNSIAICAAILELPFYNRNVPNYVNYGAFVQVLGHEFMHGFDSNGRRYDKNGAPLNWWSPESLQKFKDKTKCFENQANAVGFNGALTLTENVADNEGVRLAYKVYKKLIATLPEPEPALPGFEEFNVDQMFFMSLANGWCGEADKHVDPNDPHPPPYMRIRVMMKNMEEFSQAFNCPKQSNMNPDTRCIIW